MFDFEKGKVRFIRGGKYPQSNSVLIDDNIRTIIDPACNEEKLLSIHRERPVEVVINSHGHEDHILYNFLFPDAQLWVHELDAGVFRDMDVFMHQFFPADEMDEETKALLRNIAHHLKWVIVLLLAILGLLITRSLD